MDDDDYKKLSRYKWHAQPSHNLVYACRNIVIDGKRKMEKMHRYIMNLTNDFSVIVDHIDRNPLNNQKSNLRLCTYSQNTCNSKRRSNSKRKYKGVGFDPKVGKYFAMIMLNKISYHLGFFDTEIEAAKAYDKKAIELFKDFARLNFPIVI